MKGKLNTIISIIIGIIGIFAIILGFDYGNLTSGALLAFIKEVSEAIIGLFTLLIALQISRSFSYSKFKSIFEEHLQDWLNRNKYLVDTNKKIAGKNETKMFYYMLSKPNHANIVFKEKIASEFPDKGGQINPKGAFLYLDVNDKQEIIFGLNESFFKSKAGIELTYPLATIAETFKNRILDEFGEKLGIEIEITSDSRRLIISLKAMEKTEGNAIALIDLIEFVKAMILAVA